MIGLCIRVKLDRCLPRRLRSRVYITPGSHNTEESLNRQINDKERVAAALENPALYILLVFVFYAVFLTPMKVIEKCIVDTDFPDVESKIREYELSMSISVVYSSKQRNCSLLACLRTLPRKSQGCLAGYCDTCGVLYK